MSPFSAGMASLPYSLGSTLFSIPAAWFMGFWQIKQGNMSAQKWISFGGLVIGAVGFGASISKIYPPAAFSHWVPARRAGLMVTLDERSSNPVKHLFPFVSGVGLGLLLHAPYQVFARALQSKDMAVGTSAFFLFRFTGATIGLVSPFVRTARVIFSQSNTQSLAGTIFDIRLKSVLLSEYPGNPGTIDLAAVQSTTPLELQDEVLNAIARSIQVCLRMAESPLRRSYNVIDQTIWALCSPCLGMAALVSLPLVWPVAQ